MRPSQQNRAAARPGPHQHEHRRAEREGHPAAVQRPCRGWRRRKPMSMKETRPSAPAPPRAAIATASRRRRRRARLSPPSCRRPRCRKRWPSASDERNKSTSARTPNSSTRLTRGMKICPSWVGGGVDDFEARQQSELDRLAGERIGAGDDGLACDHGRGGRQKDERREAPTRRKQIEGVFDRLRVVEDQRALAEIVADQGRQNDEQPGRLDRPASEMAHVGVERLRAGHRQKDAAQR